jgi:gamma-glutamyltranspeptidase
MQTHGGPLATEDLAGWHASVGAPVELTIAAMKFTKRDSDAGTAFVETLNLIEGYDPRRWDTIPQPTSTR